MGIRTDIMGSGYMTDNYYRTYTRKSGTASASVKGSDASAEEAGGSSKKTEETEEPKSYREQILEKMEEMAQNIKNGTIQPKFKIGAQEYTIKEWEKLLEKFDAAEEALLEEAEAHVEEIKKQAEEEAARRAAMYGTPEPAKMTETSETAGNAAGTKEVTNVSETTAGEADVKDAAALLTDEVTKCSYPTDDPKQKHWYITAYGQDGISCKEAYFDGTRWINKDLWSFSYTEKGQYEKVMSFLKRFPQDANLRFAAHENFWKDFLAGKIDEDDFVAFFETTKDGVPDYTYEKDGSTYIDRDKVKYAKYMNGFGVQMYTAEEMEQIQRAIMNENRKGLKKLSDYGGAMQIPGDVSKQADSQEDDLQTQIVTKPDGSTVLQITTTYGVMELEITQAQKFGLMLDVGRSFDGSARSGRLVSGTMTDNK
ncbi:MAG: hypothetical protein K2J99_05695 [Lachnospiraceae bacterium]|nr:hypothetical protein [Lachnospiraceae bacterium]